MRAGCCFGLSGILLVLGCNGLQNAVAEGDTRSISLHHLHTGEDLTITYKVNGRYDDAALQKLNWELRDWRRNEATRMDPRLIDLVWDVWHEFGAKQPIQIVCGYRAPQTNAMLHRRSSGVAEHSQHTLGKAMDFYIPGVPLATLRAAGLRLERGGVGYYPTSGSPFVHMDVGGIRYWPRMSREELVRIFPDEKTVYLPSDGRPLRNYQVALAEVERRGSAPSHASLAAARDAGAIPDESGRAAGSGKGLFAKLFNFGNKDADEGDEAETAPPSQAKAASQPHPTVVATVVFDKNASVPLPRSKPDAAPAPATPAAAAPAAPAPAAAAPAAYQVAAAEPQSAPQTPAVLERPAQAPIRPAQAASLVSHGPPSPNAIINERGYWQGPEPDAPDTTGTATAAPRSGRFMTAAAGAAAVMKRAISMRRAHADTLDAETTASVSGPSKMLLAYASVPGAAEGAALAREADYATDRTPTTTISTAQDATIATKGGTTPPTMPMGRLDKAAALRAALASGERFEEPWLRSMVATPNSRGFLTTAMLGPLDYHGLSAFLVKPASAVALNFGSDPNFGATPDRFGGKAVVFVTTVTFTQRTASLR